MGNLIDNWPLAKECINWLAKQSYEILIVIIGILLIIIYLVHKYYAKKLVDANDLNQKVSHDMFSIKQQSTNTSVIAIFPEKIIDDDSNFPFAYDCKLILNSFEDLGKNFALTFAAKTEFTVKDINNNSINTMYIGGFHKLHMNEQFFKTIDNYCFVSFRIYLNSLENISLQIELTNENAKGDFKFILPS